jgi:hypothetical protein
MPKATGPAPLKAVADDLVDNISPDSFDHHALAVATIGGLFETVTDWLHTDPPEPRPINSLIHELTTFMLLIEAGIATHGPLYPSPPSQ